MIKDALSQLVETKGHEVKNHEPIVKDIATFIYNAFKTTDEQGESTSVTNAIMMTSFFSADDKTPTTKYESASAYSQMSQYLRQVYKDPANVPTISAGITATVQDCPPVLSGDVNKIPGDEAEFIDKLKQFKWKNRPIPIENESDEAIKNFKEIAIGSTKGENHTCFVDAAAMITESSK